MQALTLFRFEKSGLHGMALQAQPVPQPQAHQVLVRMKAAAFNPADLHIASGEMKMMSPVKPPFVLGVDGAGVVEQVGAAVRGFAAGDAVFFYTGLVHCGTVGEYMAVDAQALAHKPEGWSFEQAAASALAMLCANLSLSRAGVKTGQRVLVGGGGGGVQRPLFWRVREARQWTPRPALPMLPICAAWARARCLTTKRSP